jgi:hypothetical protein
VTADSRLTTVADYVLPLRWTSPRPDEEAELDAYLRSLAPHVRLIVVDGSPPDVFDRHHRLWGDLATHVAPDASTARNGKVAGVHTGLRLARSERVVIADDDVRYDLESLRRVVALLDEADLVGPQNVFRPLPWHAAWDSARSLLNRSMAADYPGTFGVRRTTFLAMGGYDGDVLFENLELMRTVRAFGGLVLRPLDVYVARRPPTADHFWGQRVRQAYDDIAQPWRLATYLPVLPLAVLGGRRGRRLVAAALGASVGLAEVGRRRAGGATHFPAHVPLLAPAWVAERSVCSWLAVGQAVLLGGVRYGERRLGVAAHSGRYLRKAAARRALVPAGGAEPAAVRAVAERLERRPAAPAERDGAPAGRDLLAVDADDAERPTQDERTVGVRRQHRRVVVPGRVALLLLGHGRAAARPDR